MHCRLAHHLNIFLEQLVGDTLMKKASQKLQQRTYFYSYVIKDVILCCYCTVFFTCLVLLTQKYHCTVHNTKLHAFEEILFTPIIKFDVPPLFSFIFSCTTKYLWSAARPLCYYSL